MASPCPWALCPFHTHSHCPGAHMWLCGATIPSEQDSMRGVPLFLHLFTMCVRPIMVLFEVVYSVDDIFLDKCFRAYLIGGHLANVQTGAVVGGLCVGRRAGLPYIL